MPRWLIGIVSRADLLRALVDASPQDGGKRVDDAQIRESILKALAGEDWWPHATINVSVENGVAELTGCITDERERTALRVLARTHPLSTLRRRPRGRLRMTRGQCGSLVLHCVTLSFTTPCRCNRRTRKA